MTSTIPEHTEAAPRWRLLGPGLVVAATGVGDATSEPPAFELAYS